MDTTPGLPLGIRPPQTKQGAWRPVDGNTHCSLGRAAEVSTPLWVVPAAGRQPAMLPKIMRLPASGRHYQINRIGSDPFRSAEGP
ncbi:hypothetical protein C9412_00350 [Stenotrophomonas sp. Nf1]|nr:hypothetical protein C9412_00350 [Stenotrophomonas sp. Nf1]PTA83299.1 hypothetical protein C9416_01540 [Stenotrophomonas sp. Nf4]